MADVYLPHDPPATATEQQLSDACEQVAIERANRAREFLRAVQESVRRAEIAARLEARLQSMALPR